MKAIWAATGTTMILTAEAANTEAGAGIAGQRMNTVEAVADVPAIPIPILITVAAADLMKIIIQAEAAMMMIILNPAGIAETDNFFLTTYLLFLATSPVIGGCCF